ncbi:MAG: glycosyltransferase family 39 protein, partial [Thiohalobacteraceae bacterium]
MTAPGRTRNSFWLLLAAWALLVVTALLTRPLLPVDETRYVGVAWEMWARGDFLVPYLNGEPYSHKPPLLFWLIQAGWWLFGVNDVWPRLVAPLIGLGCLGLTVLLARRLWPQRPLAAVLAPWLLFGCVFFAGFSTLIQFDLLIVLCTLLGMLGLQRAATGVGSGWLVVGLAIGLGVLAKGPVILLHVLPAALLGRLWVDRARLRGWAWWYGGLAAAVVLGAAIALAWALPAGQTGGPDYQRAIFWGQTAERMVDSFAHRQPFWWYLPWLPLLLLPWTLWPPLWRALRGGIGGERAGRFLLCWALPAVIALSLISGKQVKYLLPVFPALALLAAGALARVSDVFASQRAPQGLSQKVPQGSPRRQGLALALLAAPALLFGFAAFRDLDARVHWAAAIEPLWGLAFLAAAALWWRWRPAGLLGRVEALALAGVVLLVGLHVAVLRVAAPAYDLRAFSLRLGELQAAGHPVAHVGKYHGQFHFLGRLRAPLTVIDAAAAMGWARTHPDGYLVLYCDQMPEPCSGGELLQDYRGDADDLVLWAAGKWLAAQ